MREADMGQIAGWIARVRDEISSAQLPSDREARNTALRVFRAGIRDNERLAGIRGDVRALCRRFPVPGIG
jgi:hypothetical protein